MDELLDAMDTHGPPSTRFFLDLTHGELTRDLGSEGGGSEGSEGAEGAEGATLGSTAGEEPGRSPGGGDAGGDGAVAIPRADREEQRRQMRAFATRVAAPTVRAALDQALDAEDAAACFHRALTAFPTLAHAWRDERRRALLPVALGWLESLGVRPRFLLRPLDDRRHPRRAGRARPDLLDILLQGALDPTEPASRSPAGATADEALEALADTIVRRFRARDEAHALRILEGLATEATRWLGEPTEQPAPDDELRFGRLRLRRRGALVEVFVTVTAADRAPFAPEGERELDPA